MTTRRGKEGKKAEATLLEVTFPSDSANKVQILANKLTSEVFGFAQELEAITLGAHGFVRISVGSRARHLLLIAHTRRVASYRVECFCHLITRR